MSGGQKQRLALAAATLHEPELLFLDEPTSAVDPENRRAFWETLFDLVSEGTTILVSTHYMDEAERCHELVILDHGELVAQGSPEQLTRDIAAQVLLVIADQPRRVSKILETAEFVHSTAQIGIILTMTLFTAVAIVRERERGKLELLITTPVGIPELMLAKILPYILIGLVQVSLVLLLGHWLFHVPMRGSLWDVYQVSLLFIIANLAMGLMISTIARNQFQAMQLTMFVLLPSILLSGFMFPFAGMPKLAQWIAEILPMTHFMRLIRGVVLRGADLSDLTREVLILCGFIVLAMSFAILRFKKRLD